MNYAKAYESLMMLDLGRQLLNDIRNDDPEEYDKIMNSPIKGCSCGFIKEGDETSCPKCEVYNE